MAPVKEKPISEMGLIELKQHRARRFAELRSMVEKSEAEHRDLNAAEQREYDRTGEEIRQVDRRLDNITRLKEMAAHREGTGGLEARDLEAATQIATEFRDVAEGSSLGAS